MPKIHLPKRNAQLVVPDGANLMNSLLAADIPVASSCGGEGICGKCRVLVLDNPDHLSPPQAMELRRRQDLQLSSNERLSCQSMVLGSLSIDTPYW